MVVLLPISLPCPWNSSVVQKQSLRTQNVGVAWLLLTLKAFPQRPLCWALKATELGHQGHCWALKATELGPQGHCVGPQDLLPFYLMTMEHKTTM